MSMTLMSNNHTRLPCLHLRLPCLHLRLPCLHLRLPCLYLRLPCLHLRLPCTSYPQIKSQPIISCTNISLSDNWLLADLAPHLCCHISYAVSNIIMPLNDESSLLAIQGMLKRHGGPTSITSGRQTWRIPANNIWLVHLGTA